MLINIVAPLIAFLVGGIPFGVMIGKMMGVDVRSEGSGNIGATNVYRVLGKKAGTSVFLLDVAKGVAGPLLAHALAPGHDWLIAGCGIASVLGHVFSPFLNFKGGKGIATSLGAMLGLAPLGGLLAFAVWGLVLLITRYVSVASIAACIVLPVMVWLVKAPVPAVLVASLMSLMALIKHIPNMKRLASGTEPKMGERKSGGAGEPGSKGAVAG